MRRTYVRRTLPLAVPLAMTMKNDQHAVEVWCSAGKLRYNDSKISAITMVTSRKDPQNVIS